MRTQETTQQITLPDGRGLAYSEYGDPLGHPVIYCHGFPSSRLEASLVDETAQQLGVRIVAPDRPGMGASDSQTCRTLQHWPADVAALADALSMERFHLLGVSGGGPYALACLQQIGERIKGTSLVAPLGPVADARMLSSMHWSARHTFSIAMHHPFLSHTILAAFTAPIAHFWPDQLFYTLLSGMPETDRDVLTTASVREVVTASLAESMRRGVTGVQQDLDIYTAPWGFDLSHLDHPVQLWHGTNDQVVPVDHGQWIANQLPNCQAEFVEDKGHYSLPLEYSGQILGRLLEID